MGCIPKRKILFLTEVMRTLILVGCLLSVMAQCPQNFFSLDKKIICPGDTVTITPLTNNAQYVWMDFDERMPLELDSVVIDSFNIGVGVIDIEVAYNPPDSTYYLIAITTNGNVYKTALGKDLNNLTTIPPLQLEGNVGVNYLIQGNVHYYKDTFWLFAARATSAAVANWGNDLQNPMASIPTTITKWVYTGDFVYTPNNTFIIGGTVYYVYEGTTNNLAQSPSSWTISLNGESNQCSGNLASNCNKFAVLTGGACGNSLSFFKGGTYQNSLLASGKVEEIKPYVDNPQDWEPFLFGEHITAFGTGGTTPKMLYVLQWFNAWDGNPDYQIAPVLKQPLGQVVRGCAVVKYKGEYHIFLASDPSASVKQIYHVRLIEPQRTSLKDTFIEVATLQPFQVTFYEPDTYLISMIVYQDGLHSSYTDTVVVTTGPPVITEISSACAKSPTKMKVIPLDPINSVASATWDFGDGSPQVTGDSVSHSYANPGTYTVTIFLTNPFGCQDTISEQVLVYTLPSASFSTNTITCALDTVNFTNTTTHDPQDSLIVTFWQFGDGNFSLDFHPKHYYGEGGTYDVTLIVATDKDCWDTITTPIEVAGLTLQHQNACLGDTALFTLQPFYPNDTITTIQWDMGDGQGNATGTQVQYVYSDTGTYPIQIIVETTKGCQDTLVYPFRVSLKPFIDFIYQAQEFCSNTPIQFLFQGHATDGAIVQYLWLFGDGDSAITKNPIHTYPTAGNYNVYLEITDEFGCKTDTTKPIAIGNKPTAFFTILNTPCTKAPLNIRTISQNNAQYFWIWDSTYTAWLREPTIQFFESDTHTIQLIVFSPEGCSDTTTQRLFVYPSPELSLVIPQDSFVAPQTLLIKAQHSYADSFLWYVDSTLTNFQGDSLLWNFETPKVYEVKLVAFNNQGCKDSVLAPLVALEAPPVHMDLVVHQLIRQQDSLFAVVENRSNYPVTHWQWRIYYPNGQFAQTLHKGDTLSIGSIRQVLLPFFVPTNTILQSYTCVEALLPNGYPDVNPQDNKACLQEDGLVILRLYPNPFERGIFLQYSIQKAQPLTITIIDNLGRRILEQTIEHSAPGMYIQFLDLNTLSHGLYAMRLRYGNEERVLKILRW